MRSTHGPSASCDRTGARLNEESRPKGRLSCHDPSDRSVAARATVAEFATWAIATITPLATLAFQRGFAFDITFGLGQQHATAQLQFAAAWVLAGDLEFDHLALLQYVLNTLNAFPVQFADVQQAVGAGEHFHESTVRHDGFHAAFVGGAYFGLGRVRDGVHAGQGGIDARLVLAHDLHHTAAIHLVDRDVRAGLGLDLLDHA